MFFSFLLEELRDFFKTLSKQFSAKGKRLKEGLFGFSKRKLEPTNLDLKDKRNNVRKKHCRRKLLREFAAVQKRIK